MIEYLLLSGGGVKAGMIIGALTYLIDNGYLRKTKVIMGTSSGSIIGLCLTLGYKVEKIKDIFEKIDFAKFVNINIDNIVINNGLDDGNLIQNLYKSIIFEKTNKTDITFKELKILTGIHFIVTGVNISTNLKEYFDYKNTPDMCVYEAITISTRFPIFYTPYKYNSNYYLDGGIKNPYDIKKFLEIIPKNNQMKNIKILGMLINSQPQKYTSDINFLTYINNVLGYLTYGIVKLPKKYKKYTLKLKSDIHSMNISITDEEKKQLFNTGYLKADKFMEKC